jgi:hypothetical protein
LVSRQELDDLLTYAAEIANQAYEYLSRDPFTLPYKTEEEVFSSDVAVTKLNRLSKRQIEHLLRPWREWRGAGPSSGRNRDRFFDLESDRVEGDIELRESAGGNALFLANQAEEEVLGPDETVVEQAAFFLSQDEYPASAVRESFKHSQSLAFSESERVMDGQMRSRATFHIEYCPHERRRFSRLPES